MYFVFALFVSLDGVGKNKMSFNCKTGLSCIEADRFRWRIIAFGPKKDIFFRSSINYIRNKRMQTNTLLRKQEILTKSYSTKCYPSHLLLDHKITSARGSVRPKDKAMSSKSNNSK